MGVGFLSYGWVGCLDVLFFLLFSPAGRYAFCHGVIVNEKVRASSMLIVWEYTMQEHYL